MPRASRGLPRGRHRRPSSHRLPTAIGVLAVATAATGALTISGAAADVTLAQGVRGNTASALLTDRDVAAALALRAEETTERSEQRVRLTGAIEQAAAEQARADADALAAEQAALAAAAAEAAAAPMWVMPVESYEFTSSYGQRWGKLHAGVDLAAPIGTPIRAIGDGVIVEATSSGGYGNRTIVRLADGTDTWYCHQSAFEVTSGPVTAGQVIGYVGSTGNSTGPHLHFEVHPGGGDAIDPTPWAQGLGLVF